MGRPLKKKTTTKSSIAGRARTSKYSRPLTNKEIEGIAILMTQDYKKSVEHVTPKAVLKEKAEVVKKEIQKMNPKEVNKFVRYLTKNNAMAQTIYRVFVRMKQEQRESGQISYSNKRNLEIIAGLIKHPEPKVSNAVKKQVALALMKFEERK